MPIGDSDAQQIWEGLAILVAVVLWSTAWKQQRIMLKVKSDNVSALTMLTKLRTKANSPELAIIARELALHLVELSFPPDAEHVSGIGHKFADALSRVYAPTGMGILTDDLHPAMKNARAVVAPVRGPSYYIIRTAPRARRVAKRKKNEALGDTKPRDGMAVV